LKRSVRSTTPLYRQTPPPAFLKLDLMYLILAKRTGHEKWPATIGLQAIFYFKNNKLRGGERGIRTLDGDFVPILP
jgi:hypothetical protein